MFSLISQINNSHPMSIELITANVVSVGVPIWRMFRPSIAPLNRNGTQTLRTFAPPRRLNDTMTLKDNEIVSNLCNNFYAIQNLFLIIASSLGQMYAIIARNIWLDVTSGAFKSPNGSLENDDGPTWKQCRICWSCCGQKPFFVDVICESFEIFCNIS